MGDDPGEHGCRMRLATGGRFGVRCITEVIPGNSKVITVQRYVSARTLEDRMATGSGRADAFPACFLASP